MKSESSGFLVGVRGKLDDRRLSGAKRGGYVLKTSEVAACLNLSKDSPLRHPPAR